MATRAPSDIGDFIIGVSPIGVVTPPFDLSTVTYSQYANSPVLLAVMEAMQGWLDPAELIDNWYDAVWNVATAVGWGLDVWGRIVGVSRTVAGTTAKYLGFEEATSVTSDPFGQSPFFSGTLGSTGNFVLSDDAFRQLIYAKAAANIWDGSILGLNVILRILFPGQNVYVVDNLNMTMTFFFGFTPSPVQQAIIINTGVLPKPAGVSVSYSHP